MADPLGEEMKSKFGASHQLMLGNSVARANSDELRLQPSDCGQETGNEEKEAANQRSAPPPGAI